jgi:hypothetical protein
MIHIGKNIFYTYINYLLNNNRDNKKPSRNVQIRNTFDLQWCYMGFVSSWIEGNQFTINQGLVLQVMSFDIINDAKLLEMWKRGSVSMWEGGRCRFSTQDLQINNLKSTEYSYEHMAALGATMSWNIGSGRGIWLGHPVLCIFNAYVDNSCYSILMCNLAPTIAIFLSNIESGKVKTLVMRKLSKDK